ncbi:hypothetical protein C0993_010604 [Termitomyces sp. T159_Od127]|nr:hypothetical protein C0993_010604 [Termitomyces sp. T159_Od127]
MTALSSTIDAPKRYRNLTRHILADASCCRPNHLKKRCQGQKKTAAAKAEAKARRNACQEDYSAALQRVIELVETEAVKLHEQFGGHTVDYYKAEILQVGRMKIETRAVSRWNAYLRHEVKLANENCEEGQERQKAHQLSKALCEKWNAMSEEEKITLTDPLIEELKDHRANMQYGRHNVEIGTFNDTTQCLLAMEHYMTALHARTGTELFLVATQSLGDGFLRPFVTCTSDHVRSFPYHQFKTTFVDLAAAFEAYCVAGVEGLVNKHMSNTAELKAKLKNLINSSLETLLGKVRMVYVGFEEKFTVSYGVVIEKWPIERFISPSTTFFWKMEQDEWEQWREKHLALGTSVLSSSPSTNSTTSLNGASPSAEGPMEVDVPTMPSSEQENPVPQFAPSPLMDIMPAANNNATLQFINSSGTGTGPAGVRKQKQRSNARKKRGPRKVSSSTEATATPSS